jgi:hypothetical protein
MPYLFFIIIFCSSCVADEVQYCSYVIYRNKTAKTIVIEGFEKSKKLPVQREIKPNSDIEILVNVRDLYDYRGIFGGLVDSVCIKFSNEKVIYQYCEGRYLDICRNEIPRNIISDWIYFGEKGYFKKSQNGCIVSKGKQIYTFDQSDYDRALPIKK